MSARENGFWTIHFCSLMVFTSIYRRVCVYVCELLNIGQLEWRHYDLFIYYGYNHTHKHMTKGNKWTANEAEMTEREREREKRKDKKAHTSLHDTEKEEEGICEEAKKVHSEGGGDSFTYPNSKLHHVHTHTALCARIPCLWDLCLVPALLLLLLLVVLWMYVMYIIHWLP